MLIAWINLLSKCLLVYGYAHKCVCVCVCVCDRNIWKVG